MNHEGHKGHEGKDSFDGVLTPYVESLGRTVLDACYCVHSALGPGLLESVYESCLAIELDNRGLKFQRQLGLPLYYAGHQIDAAYRLDFLVENAVVVELKAVAEILPVHHAQLLTYLRLSRNRLGFLINFNTVHLRQGIKRYVI